MNNQELFEATQKSINYLISEHQKGEQRIIDTLETKFEKLEHRVTILEHWRTLLTGACAGVLAWWKYGGKLHNG